MTTETPEVRTGQGSTELTRTEFERRYRAQFVDSAFDAAKPEVERLTGIAWEAYGDIRKNVHTRKVGPEFADPEHELSLECAKAANRPATNSNRPGRSKPHHHPL